MDCLSGDKQLIGTDQEIRAIGSTSGGRPYARLYATFPVPLFPYSLPARLIAHLIPSAALDTMPPAKPLPSPIQ